MKRPARRSRFTRTRTQSRRAYVDLMRRLEESEETIRAVRDGAVDAIVVQEGSAQRVYTLDGVDRPYRLLVERMQQGAATLHADGTIAYCNQRLAELLGVPHERLVGVLFQDFITADDQRLYEILVREGRQASASGEVTLLRPAGGDLPTLLTVNSLPKDCGASLGVLVTDLTPQRHHEQLRSALHQQKQAEEALRESETRLREANRIKDEFLATLSHELRTPLNAVLGWADMLREGTLPPEMQRRALESVVRNAKAQAQLVNDLLDVSRIVSGKMEIRRDTVDLRAVIASAIETVRVAATAKSIKLIGPADRDATVLVLGDADRLRQVVWNLLSNAIKFTQSGGTVQVELRHVESTAEIVVHDTGVGIAEYFLPHVFERFRQADSTFARRHGGLGIGLAIVRHLTEVHGGTVSVESEGEGRGATFTVRLPVSATGWSAAVAVAPPVELVSVLAGAHVLVVDDEPDARQLLQTLLEVRGAAVTQASSGGEALYELQRRSFDVLICDIGMPEQDGCELIRAVRALPPQHGAGLPAIAVTAYATTSERDTVLEAGFDWHLPKPVNVNQVVEVVSQALRRSAAKL